jgi:putative transposase
MIRTHVFKATQPKSLLDDLNQESGRIYTSVTVEHWRIMRHSEVWLSPFTQMRYNDFLHPDTTLHAHSRDAAQQGFAKACKTAKALKKNGDTKARYPYKRKKFRTTSWKNTGIRVKSGVALLARARGIEPVRVELPEALSGKEFVEARLVYNKRSSKYEWHFVVDDGIETSMRAEGCVVAVDMGEIHPAACTNGTDALVVSARELRSTGQGLAKKIANLDEMRARCKKGSRRHKRLSKAKAKARTRKEYKQRDILHKVSRAVVEYAVESGAKEIVVGDVREIADGVDIGKKTNQKISLWPHGKLRGYIEYKALALGIATVLQEERYTSQTCPGCGKRQKPRGRVYRCSECKWTGHRDGQVGAPNILSKYLFGECGRVFIPNQPKYRHPYITGKRSRADTAHVAFEVPHG